MTSTLQGATRSGSNGGTAPAAGRPTTIKRRRSWRPGLLALSLFLIVGSMLAGLWLYQSTTSRVGILHAATALQPGDQLTVADTRVQYVAAEPDFLQALFTEDQATATGFYGGTLGLTVSRSIPAGAPLVRDYLVPDENLIPEGKAIVGVNLELGSYPNLISDGHTVDMQSASDDDEQLTSVSLGEAVVWSAVVDPDNGRLRADLIVELEDQNAVVQAHRNDLLRLTLVDGGF
ncbi:MAG: hypothetical protein OEW83_12665 [Acidimicrobiia bacterium]|nr:hypothetical protein [Acidimicrobiia bacterium]